MMCPPVFRFAPSPSGLLHLGHAFSALYSARAARRAGGRFLLRIEDIDTGRCRDEFVTQIYEDLAWLGLEWEQPVRRQSAHMGVYAEALDQLKAQGLVFPCPATRRQIAGRIGDAPDQPRDPDGGLLYPARTAPGAADPWPLPARAGEPVAWRLDMARAVRRAQALATQRGEAWGFWEDGQGPQAEHSEVALAPEIWGDVVLARKDIGTSYHLSVVVDDALQGVTHVTRGQDLYAATHIHRVLQILLGLPAPRYDHHGLVRDMAGRRLSKTDRDTSLKSLRAAGCTPQDVMRLCGFAEQFPENLSG